MLCKDYVPTYSVGNSINRDSAFVQTHSSHLTYWSSCVLGNLSNITYLLELQ